MIGGEGLIGKEQEDKQGGLKQRMARVIEKFFITSMLMWAVPIAILYAFNNNLFPGIADMSPYSLTLLSGFLAVVSVNVVIAFYIYLAMREPSEKHEPDPKFVSEAEASVKHLVPNETPESSSARKKEE
ncbi:Vacuolar ATPase assembly integral membrane protein VMA21-like domain-containing protein [Cynara cardunculus var. scolymus]|uniref:Vacuolar ATPase assembly integral membrane protein VMA21 homolog n=2 Tax=Cynara cardunculus var. scolymus TaxID=59895 RepID=A0A103YEQ2_CYNCS|nr:Vacuolar ATPase assembly integral membrane protein VMA21-like domain-containing protein [Cynara cardunculus var. scolymus]